MSSRRARSVVPNIPALLQREKWTSKLRGQLLLHGIVPPQLVEEHRFHPVRQFRFDFALPEFKIGIEVEGGIFMPNVPGGRGRHVTPQGYESDCLKYNIAAADGWCVLRYTPDMIVRAEAPDQVLYAMKLRRAVP